MRGAAGTRTSAHDHDDDDYYYRGQQPPAADLRSELARLGALVAAKKPAVAAADLVSAALLKRGDDWVEQ